MTMITVHRCTAAIVATTGYGGGGCVALDRQAAAAVCDDCVTVMATA